jgi:hypothetical protein
MFDRDALVAQVRHVIKIDDFSFRLNVLAENTNLRLSA